MTKPSNMLVNILAILTIAVASAAPSAMAAPASNSSSKIVVDFPRAYSIGTLSVGDANTLEGYFTPIGPAQGRILFDRKKRYGLDAGPHLLRHPEALDTLPADSLDSIRLRFSSFDDAEDGLCDKTLAHVARLTGLTTVTLDRSEVTDQGLAKLKGLKKLTDLYLFSTLVKGDIFKDVPWKELQTLKMAHNMLGNECYQYFHNYPRLKTLDLARCHPDTQGLAGVGKCTNLIHLDLAGNQTVNDSNIKYLKTLKKLQFLDLVGTNVTANGLAMLRELPLKQINVSGNEFVLAKLSIAKKAFPRASFLVKGENRVGSDEAAIFAPLH